MVFAQDYRGAKLFSGVAQRFIERIIDRSIPKLREQPEEHLEVIWQDEADKVPVRKYDSTMSTQDLNGAFSQMSFLFRPKSGTSVSSNELVFQMDGSSINPDIDWFQGCGSLALQSWFREGDGILPQEVSPCQAVSK